MRKTITLCAAALLTCSIAAHADFQYQSTSRVTGGALIQMMRFVPGGGALKEPQISTVAVKGSRLVRRDKRQTEIIDLDSRTITTVSFEKRTYTEMTFDQMKATLDRMSTAMSQQQQKSPDAPKVDLNVDADIQNTGRTKTIEGMEARQFIVTMSMAATDPQSGQSGAMKMNSEMWMAKDIPGADEMRAFYQRMSKELDWAPTGMGSMMNRPDISRAMSKMMAEGEKMDGTAIQQIVRIGMEGPAGQQAQSAPAPSVSDALGSALGSRLGGLGGFGRKKKQDPAPDAPPSGQTSASLMEMTIDSSGFSTGAVDASLFAIPSGFRKIEQLTPEAAPRK